MKMLCIKFKNLEDLNYAETLIDDKLNEKGIEHEIFTQKIK